MYEAFFKFYNCNEDIKPSAAFSCRHIKYKIHAPECTKTRHFYFKKSKNFLGRGHSPLLRPLPHPPPLGACGASIFETLALSHAPPTRKSGYGPVSVIYLRDTAKMALL